MFHVKNILGLAIDDTIRVQERAHMANIDVPELHFWNRTGRAKGRLVRTGERKRAHNQTPLIGDGEDWEGWVENIDFLFYVFK